MNIKYWVEINKYRPYLSIIIPFNLRMEMMFDPKN